MDKKKIFKLIFLLFFFSNNCFAESVLYNIKTKQAIYQDSNKNLFNVEKSFLEKTSEFDYYLFRTKKFPDKVDIKFLYEEAAKEIEIKKALEDTKKNKLLKSTFLPKSSKEIILLTLNKNEKEIKTLEKNLNKYFDPIEINSEKLLNMIDTEGSIKEKDNKYYFNRATKKNYVSNWHYKTTWDQFVVQKSVYRDMPLKKYLLFHIETTCQCLPSKINMRFLIQTSDNRTLRLLKTTYFNQAQTFEITSEGKNKVVAFDRINFEQSKDSLLEYKKITLKEIILFYDKKSQDFFLAGDPRYDFFYWNEGKNFYMKLNNDNKQILIPKSMNIDENFNEKTFSLPFPLENVANNVSFSTPSYGAKTYEIVGYKGAAYKKKWHNTYQQLIKLVENNPENTYLYATEIKNIGQIKQSDKLNFIEIFIKYIFFTIGSVLLITYALSRKFVITKFYRNIIIKSGILIMVLLIILNLTNQQIELYTWSTFSFFIVPLEIFFGYLLFFIYIITCITEERTD